MLHHRILIECVGYNEWAERWLSLELWRSTFLGDSTLFIVMSPWSGPTYAKWHLDSSSCLAKVHCVTNEWWSYICRTLALSVATPIIITDSCLVICVSTRQSACISAVMEVSRHCLITVLRQYFHCLGLALTVLVLCLKPKTSDDCPDASLMTHCHYQLVDVQCFCT